MHMHGRCPHTTHTRPPPHLGHHKGDVGEGAGPGEEGVGNGAHHKHHGLAGDGDLRGRNKKEGGKGRTEERKDALGRGSSVRIWRARAGRRPGVRPSAGGPPAGCRSRPGRPCAALLKPAAPLECQPAVTAHHQPTCHHRRRISPGGRAGRGSWRPAHTSAPPCTAPGR